MSIDKTELRRLAESILWTGDWYNAGCGTANCKYEGTQEHAELAHPEPNGAAEYIGAVGPKVVLALLDEIDAQAREIEAMRADAEQYRWLRSQHWNDGTLAVLRSADLPLGVQTFSGQLLDDAITVRRMAAPASQCTCPSGDGSLRWPCPVHPPAPTTEAGAS